MCYFVIFLLCVRSLEAKSIVRGGWTSWMHDTSYAWLYSLRYTASLQHPSIHSSLLMVASSSWSWQLGVVESTLPSRHRPFVNHLLTQSFMTAVNNVSDYKHIYKQHFTVCVAFTQRFGVEPGNKQICWFLVTKIVLSVIQIAFVNLSFSIWIRDIFNVHCVYSRISQDQRIYFSHHKIHKCKVLIII